jgi:quinol monooxygenase YgiN
MIIAKIKMNALPEKRKEVLDTILSILKELIKGL